MKQIARMTLGSGNMQLAVELPAGEDFNEWLAVNTIEFYNESKLSLTFSKCSLWHFDRVLHSRELSNYVSRTKV